MCPLPSKYQRLYEAAILKTLGAKCKVIVLIALIEYGVLGLPAGLIGSAAAIRLTWAFAKYELYITRQPTFGVDVMRVPLMLLLVSAVGVASSWDVIRKKPLSILRGE